jgi:spectinomycin phosphotransferase
MHKRECTMNTPPPANDLDPAMIAEMLTRAWSLPPVSLAYRRVGFGSHHWLATAVGDDRRWFVTVDDLRGRRQGSDRLQRALRVAWLLHHDAGIPEVVAPLMTLDGRILATLAGDRWAVALYPFLPLDDPGDGAFTTDDARVAAQRLVARIHAATPLIPNGLAPEEDFVIPHRDAWLDIATRVDAPWTTGPYGEPARHLLRPHVGRVMEGLTRYDALVTGVLGDGSPWVITHGEPHAANILARGDGQGLAIVDWDTVALAPRERDLWQLLSTPGSPEAHLAAYLDALPPDGERPVSASAIALYRLRWDLSEIILYARWFSDPHDDIEDMRVGRDDLAGCLESLDHQLANA